MSYDIFCYKSKLGRPDEDEANAVIDADTDQWAEKEQNYTTKLALVKALTEYNSRLEAFDFDYGEIAKHFATAIESKDNFDPIELNPPRGDIAIQLTVYSNHVFITAPYWYQGEKAKQLFRDIKNYIRIINDTAGYFVFDPQTGQAFDPAENDFDGLNEYLSASKHPGKIISLSGTTNESKKPWWKFW